MNKSFLKHVQYLAIFLYLVFCASGVAAATEISWRQVSHVNESHPNVIPDSGGYTLGTGKGSGLGFFSDGQIATINLAFNIDYKKGDGDFVAYETYTFPDGSTLVLKRNGRTITTGGGSGADFDGTFKLVGGTGRYRGISGDGVFTGKRLSPLGSGADQYFDFKVNAVFP